MINSRNVHFQIYEYVKQFHPFINSAFKFGKVAKKFILSEL